MHYDLMFGYMLEGYNNALKRGIGRYNILICMKSAAEYLMSVRFLEMNDIGLL